MAQWLEKVEGVFHGFDPKLPWTDFPIAVIDFETTGFDANLDRVVEVGVVCFHRGVLTDKKNWLIQPGHADPRVRGQRARHHATRWWPTRPASRRSPTS